MSSISALGIDIGGTYTKIALVAADGSIQRQESIPTGSHGDLSVYLSRLKETIQTFLPSAPRGIGISLPGFLTDDGRSIVYNPNTPALVGIDFVDWLAVFGLPVHTEQDLNSPALAEFYFGSGMGSRRFIAAAIGTGVGIGVILNGNVMRFTGYTTGDSGHIILEPDGPECTGGCKGCAEALVTISAIERDALLMLEGGCGESLRIHLKEGRIPAQEVISMAQAGDPSAGKIMRAIGRRLGLWLASLAPIFLPDRIALCGGVAEAGQVLLEACQQRFYELAGPEYARCTIVLGHFRGLAGVIGAATPFLVRE
jgi:glucokinase